MMHCLLFDVIDLCQGENVKNTQLLIADNSGLEHLYANSRLGPRYS